MATRGTYKIGKMLFWCHWDNYPSGAALRLYRMIDKLTQPDDENSDGIKPCRGGLEFAFIRGNIDAEPSDGGYGGEYHYEIYQESEGVLMIKCYCYNFKGEKILIKCIDLVSFINSYVTDDPEKNMGIEKVVSVVNADSLSVVTERTARKLADIFLKKADDFASSNPNRKQYLQLSKDFSV